MLEALVSLMLMSICLGAVAGLFSYSTAQIRQARLQTRAMLLAETKMAELQVGLNELIEGTAGDFDGRPPNFTWKVDIQPTDVPEVSRVTVTIGYDDGGDQLEYQLYRLFSPSLNFSTEKLTEIANDPAELERLDSSGLGELLPILSELPGGKYLQQIALGAGVSELMRLLNKMLGGGISPDVLLALTGDSEGDKTDTSIAMLISPSDADRANPPAWNDFETAGIGTDPMLARAEVTASEPTSVPATQPSGEEEASTGGAETGREGTGGVSRPRTREEAINEMMEILRKLARERRR
jgi:type II secretory pathway pseudopilin PulG